MIRVLLVAALLAAAGAAAVASMGAGDDGGKRYRVELDNAFGLVDGADVKVAGVRAGSISGFEVDPRTYRALVDIEIDQGGFGDLRADVFCESRPQSLIGEYFLDCRPGTSKRKLPDGARIPVRQTGSTIPVDLVNNIMRRPYRERFSIIIGELGAALAGRGTDLNETIRRANPALRETDKVLAELAAHRRIIADLTTNADRVVTRLADERTEVTRFITEARDTASASAERREDIRAQLQRFPTFLRELRPTMARLGEAADRQTPALRTLSSQAPLLRSFFDTLGPFSEASRPAFRTLAAAAEEGRETIPVARPQIRQLGEFAEPLPELTENLAITLEHLDDRRFAIEKDPRSPGGQGFTGFEAILSYIFRQSQATNVFDDNSYLLKVSAFLDETCAQYTDAEQAKDPKRDRCLAALGPGRPGIDERVATRSRKAERPAKKKKRARRRAKGAPRRGADAPRRGADAPRPGPAAPLPSPYAPLPSPNAPLPLPTAPRPSAPDTPLPDKSVLDYLLAP